MSSPKTLSSIQSNSNGFTLIELLVVISIIAILATLIFSGLGNARKKATETGCLSNLRSMAIGFQGYAADHNGRFPAVANNQAGGGFIMWHKSGIGPYITDATDSEEIGKSKVFQCPAATTGGATYGMNQTLPDGNTTGWQSRSRYREKIPVTADQQSKTCLVIDSVHAVVGETYSARVLPAAERHGGAVNVLFLDSHVARMDIDQIPFVGVPAENGELTADLFWKGLVN